MVEPRTPPAKDPLLEQLQGAAKQSVPAFERAIYAVDKRDYKTAAAYQMYHALALVAVGLLSQIKPKRSLQIAGCCFLGGILLFSGSLYILALTDIRWMGAVTPFGGTAFLLGWGALAWHAARRTV